MRVYEVAKELNVPTKALRDLMEKKLNLTYPSHMSTIEDEDIEKVKAIYRENRQNARDRKEKAAAPSAEKKDPKKKDKSPSHKKAKKAKNREDLEEEEEDRLEAKLKNQAKARTKKKASKQGEEKKKKPQAKKEEKVQKPEKAREEEKTPPQEEDEFDAIIEIPAEITVGDFAKVIHQDAMQVITVLIKMGIMAGLNESITFETAEKVADHFGVLITEPEESLQDEIFDHLDFEDAPKTLKTRPPVITVMGHVDHGKTSILDAIRETAVTRGEAGGITQHIGASVAYVNGHKLTFLDTPGHEAFTQMRARGAKTTDIVILVVAADDGVMPQTVEAINHAKAANVPIVVAINKMDRHGANPDRVKQELMEYELVAEEWGGDTIMVPVSAKTKEGIEDLLDNVVILSEILELKANPKRPAVGVIIESQLEKGKGATASILVQKGTLTDDDYVVSGTVSGHIRAMEDSFGKRVKKAGPSMPVKIMGLSDLPEAGDKIYAVKDEKVAREYAEKAAQRARKERLNMTTHVSLDDLHMQISEEGLKELNLVVKTDVKGTIDALAGSLEKLSNEEVKVNIIHGAVGGISESDVMLAVASNAIIIGFNVRPNQGAIAQAARESIDIRTYRVIYDAIEDIKKAIEGMLSPDIVEEVTGRAEVRDTFKVPNAGLVAGIYVVSGKMVRNYQARLLRNDVVIFEGDIASLRRFKDDVREIAHGYEGGLGIANYNDIKVGDMIECYHEVEVAQKLD